VKFVPLALTPLFLVAGWRAARDRKRFAWQAGALLALAGVVLYVPYFTPGQTWEELALRPFRQSTLFTTSLPAMLSFWLEGQIAQDQAQNLARNLALAGWGLFALWQTWRLWRQPAVPPAVGFAFLVNGCYAVLLYFLLIACLWFQPWYLVWLLALAPLLGPSPHVGAVMLFSALVQLKYFIFGFAWLWRTPMDDILVPEAVTTALIFAPMLLVYGWLAGRRLRWRQVDQRQNTGNRKQDRGLK
jgi:hypothetical protein